MKICVLGASGQLGKELLLPSRSQHLMIGFDEKQCDITARDAVRDVLSREEPDVVINAAAYTAVDKAEEERALAFAVNDEGVRNIAIVAREISARLITISTDYVFGGVSQRELNTPLHEDSPTDPCNVYGASKRAGELATQEEYPEGTLVVRTSSLHGAQGPNFVHTILRLLEEREEISVVADQVMSPTWAGWLADVLLQLAAREEVGYLHASSAGAITWYQFAEAIRELASFEYGAPASITPIPTEQYPTPAQRPRYSVFDCSRLEKTIPGVVVEWKEGLCSHLAELGRLA
jgi:dTDP-4-dehydrorhamnose reductase